MAVPLQYKKTLPHEVLTVPLTYQKIAHEVIMVVLQYQ